MHQDFNEIREISKPYRILLLPGLDNCCDQHWLSQWEYNMSNSRRVVQDNWGSPELHVWRARLQAAAEQCYLTYRQPMILVGHSLGAWLAADWAQHNAEHDQLPVEGALLVAPPALSNPNFPDTALYFEESYQGTLPLPAMCIASSNDHYATTAEAQSLSNQWGAEFINVGEQGHITTDSNLGHWNDGLGYLSQLIKKIEQPTASAA